MRDELPDPDPPSPDVLRPDPAMPNPLHSPDGRHWLLELAEGLRDQYGDPKLRLVRRLNRALAVADDSAETP